MDFLTDWLTNWLKELLIGGIMGNLEGLFDTVNTQVGEIAAQVGTTPATWNAGVFSLIRQLSETVILPIAGMVLTFVATYELIQMLLEKNNMHEVDVANGNSHTDTYQVPYDYYICTVTLENFNLSHVPVYVMGEDQLSRYAIYMATLGNRPDLFPDSPYVNKYITGKPGDYEVPGEYLDDETFAAMLAEAQKYIGYPYVWGGSSPATSFDCSGYVSWVINHSGWNVGRLGAQGLYNICTPTSSPKPGDLVFFKGTYDTPGVSHCGIYVGDGKMLHCGDPIGYANLNTSYWQSHFYAYGRLP